MYWPIARSTTGGPPANRNEVSFTITEKCVCATRAATIPAHAPIAPATTGTVPSRSASGDNACPASGRSECRLVFVFTLPPAPSCSRTSGSLSCLARCSA